MRYRLIIYSLLVASLTPGCQKRDLNKVIQDKDLTLQVGRINENGKDGYNFKARITPLQAVPGKNKDINTDMMFRMDSTFFIMEGTRKIYPGMIQYIADGVKGSFEYMILFDDDLKGISDSVHLVYQDRYLNQKKYELTFFK